MKVIAEFFRSLLQLSSGLLVIFGLFFSSVEDGYFMICNIDM